jgi:hypothetical protein
VIDKEQAMNGSTTELQHSLVTKLKEAIASVEEVIALEQKMTHNAHPNWTYSQILNDMRSMLDAEKALLRSQEVLGR